MQFAEAELQLYTCLDAYSKFIGLFEGMDKSSPSGALYSVHWQADCLQLTQLVMCRSGIKQVPVIRLGPSHPHATAQLLDSDKIVVTQTKATRGFSAAAVAAAATAGKWLMACLLRWTWLTMAGHGLKDMFDGSIRAEGIVRMAFVGISTHFAWETGAHHPGLHEDALGCSPPQSFGFEMLHFMAAAIKGGGGSRRNSGSSRRLSSSPQQGGCSSSLWRDEVKLCLVRLSVQASTRQHPLAGLSVQASTRQHPLAGLWKGVYAGHGMEVLSLAYDFSGAVARIIATKVTGDANVPAGQTSWSCPAAGLPLPWPHDDVASIEQRQSDALEEMEDLLFEGEDEQAASRQRDAKREGTAVVGLYHGQVQVAGPGFAGPSFVAGRLWVLQDGSLSVVVPEFPHVLLSYTRLDAPYGC
ncbi:MAG: hypothetical protein WDW38_005021 [Sanguina aurantia]